MSFLTCMKDVEITDTSPNPALIQLFGFFLSLGITAFGVGFASVPLMFHEIVEVRSWMDAPTFLNGIVLGQFTPWPIVITTTFWVILGSASFARSWGLFHRYHPVWVKRSMGLDACSSGLCSLRRSLFQAGYFVGDSCGNRDFGFCTAKQTLHANSSKLLTAICSERYV